MDILVVEDEKKLARALELELKYEGYQTATIHDGREALQHIKEKDYDLILLDIMLPSLSGMEILRRMRKDKIHTPVILLTARDATYDKVSGMDLGAKYYIYKTFILVVHFARIN